MSLTVKVAFTIVIAVYKHAELHGAGHAKKSRKNRDRVEDKKNRERNIYPLFGSEERKENKGGETILNGGKTWKDFDF